MAILNDMVTISDNGRTETMKRADAIKLYYEAMLCSEGSAQSRYCTIYLQLLEGESFCSDGC